MDASEGANKTNGNGHADPSPISLPSAAAAPSGAPVSSSAEKPAGSLEVPRDEHGRVMPGHSLNEKGRPKGSVNRNTQLQRGFEKLREVIKQSPELVRKLLKRYGINAEGIEGDELLIALAFAKSVVDRDDALLKHVMQYVYTKLDVEGGTGGVSLAAVQGGNWEAVVMEIRNARASAAPPTRPGMEDLD